MCNFAADAHDSIMIRKSLYIVCWLMVSLASDAKISLPDSLLTISKSHYYFISSPDTTRAILETIRERQLEPEWRITLAEGDLNYYQRDYPKALTFYGRVKADPSVTDSAHVQMLLLKRMADSYEAINKNDELVEAIYALRKMAKASGNKAFESMSIFTNGKIHHYHGQRDMGYSSCLQALEMLKETDFPMLHAELRNYYADLLRMYARDGRYDEAMHMSQYQESEALYPTPITIRHARERGLRQVYALRASMLAQAGRMVEADYAYASWKKVNYSNAIDDMDIFDYLRLRHYDNEALGVINRYRELICQQGDTVSYRYLEALNKEALLYLDMGNSEQAAVYGRQVATIAQSIYIQNSGLQMQTTYDLLKEQSASQYKTMWLILLAAGILIVSLVVLIILYYVRKERRHYRDMHRLVNVLNAYRQAVVNGESSTSPKVVAAIQELRSIKLPADISQEKEEEPDDEDGRLYVQMDKQVTRDRLFLKPGLSREDLMRLIGVDKNRFGKMMSKYSDASNTSVYINTKRVQYGAQLLLEHPEYTIATVAIECGMSNTVTFNRTFKEMYNMTPSEYREKMTLQ